MGQSLLFCIIPLDAFLKIRTRKCHHLPKFQGWGSGRLLSGSGLQVLEELEQLNSHRILLEELTCTCRD